jgi:NAD(P)-dependent dehydrogenase (short-subunit alcohol dehydrogenase family)
MITKALVANGAKVYISSRRLEVIEKVASELSSAGPGQCIAMQADLSSKEACERLAKEMGEREGYLDFLVNNSGIAVNSNSLEEFPEDGWDDVFRINTTTPFQLTMA